MRISTISRMAVLAASFSLISFPTMAEGLYFIAGIGSTNITTDDTDFDSDSTSFRIGIGSTLENKNLAVEGYYIDYGTATDFGIDVSGTAIAVQGVGKAKASGNLSFFGKVGFAMWDGDAGGGSESGTDLYYGLGLENALDSKSAFRLEYEAIAFDLPDDTVYGVTFGVRYLHDFN